MSARAKSKKTGVLPVAKPTKAGAVASKPIGLSRLQSVVVGLTLFLLAKIPLCFVTVNPEELRDLDAYLRFAEGQGLYRDFVWIYGPLSPLLYGTAFKILPANLITLRLLVLGIWSVGVIALALTLRRYFKDLVSFACGMILVTACFGAGGYGDNHVVAAVAALVGFYQLIRYAENKEASALIYAFLSCLIVLLIRPVLLGYSLTAGWFGFLIWKGPKGEKAKIGTACLSAAILVVGVAYVRFGDPLIKSFLPPSGRIALSEGYPNLINLVPSFHRPLSLSLMIKAWRGVMDTIVFYLHYFLWPTFLVTFLAFRKKSQRYRVAGLAMVMSLLSSLDLLVYGLSDPSTAQLLEARSQYFFAYTSLSLFLILWPASLERMGTRARAIGAGSLLLSLGLWSYYSVIAGIYQVSRFPINPNGLPIFRGIAAHPTRDASYEAAAFVNSKCRPQDYVLVGQEDPGVNRLLVCKDIFAADIYVFVRNPAYEISPWESPYVQGKPVTSQDLIAQRTVQHPPKFYLVAADSPVFHECDRPGWAHKDFGSGASFRRVCWSAL